MQNYALWQFGPVARKIQEPFTGRFNLFYLEYPYYRILIAALSAAIIGGFWLFLKYGRFGVWIRATMIPKSVQRFPEKIILKQEARAG